MRKHLNLPPGWAYHGPDEDPLPIRRLRDEPQEVYWLDERGGFRLEVLTKVVGITMPGRRQNLQPLRVGMRLQLLREPDNPADSNAVQVLNPSGAICGFLRRELAADLAPIMDRGERVECTVHELALYAERVQALRVRLCREGADGPEPGT